MEQERALAALPAPYALALQMAEAGATPEAIAAAAGVSTDAVPALLEIGKAKLLLLLDAPDPVEAPESELGM